MDFEVVEENEEPQPKFDFLNEPE